MFTEKQKEKRRVYYQLHKEKHNLRMKELHIILRKEVITMYGGKCACCGETEYKFLAIDHINNDGASHRKLISNNKPRWKIGGAKICRWLKKHNYPNGFQILCHNCNMAKGFYGKCPHHI